jgi:hypothetical protein
VDANTWTWRPGSVSRSWRASFGLVSLLALDVRGFWQADRLTRRSVSWRLLLTMPGRGARPTNAHPGFLHVQSYRWTFELVFDPFRISNYDTFVSPFCHFVRSFQGSYRHKWKSLTETRAAGMRRLNCSRMFGQQDEMLAPIPRCCWAGNRSTLIHLSREVRPLSGPFLPYPGRSGRSAKGRFARFARPSADGRYWRIPTEDRSRHKALVAALIDSQLAQELPLAMVGERRPWVG